MNLAENRSGRSLAHGRRHAEMSSGPQAGRRPATPTPAPAHPPWYLLHPGSDQYRGRASTLDPRNGKEQPMRACASSVISPVASSFARQCQAPDLKEASNSR